MWNKWLIIELVIISGNEVKKMVISRHVDSIQRLFSEDGLCTRPFTSSHDPRIVSILSTMYSLICDEHLDTQYSRFLFGRQGTKPLKEQYPLITQFRTDDFINQLPAFLLFNLLFLKSLRLVEDQAMHYRQSHFIKQQKTTGGSVWKVIGI